MKSFSTYYLRYVHLSFLLILLSIVTANAQVGIGTNKPDKSSMLEVSSTSRGVLISRMTSQQRLGISNPANGLLVFDSDSSRFFYYETTSKKWTSLASSSGGGSTSGAGSLWDKSGTNIYNTNTGNVGIGTNAPNTNSILDITSTSKGILIPRLTSLQRTGITSPTNGLLVYDNTLNAFYYFNGSAWAAIASGSITNYTAGTGIEISGTTINSVWTKTLNNISNNNTGNVGIGKSPTFKMDVDGPINADSFMIGGNRVVSTKGINNIFVGVAAGLINTGNNNSFVGKDAGQKNTTGSFNAFLGTTAGASNTTGSNNSFVGQSAGFNNTTGFQNSFFGKDAGFTNTTGSFNSFYGRSAGYSNTTGSANVFFGNDAGYANTTGSANSMFGAYAGVSNTIGSQNQFMGFEAGHENTTGNYNYFSGYGAGRNNTTASQNQFIGYQAGIFNTTGIQNHFVGYQAGFTNSTGEHNYFSGFGAGYYNTTGSQNYFSGYLAGLNNTTGYSNTSAGTKAGYSFNGTRNTFIGDSADANTNGLTNATALGYDAKVSQSNSMLFGNSSVTKWGFGVNPGAGNIIEFANTTAVLTTGGTWTNASDSTIKENIIPVDGKLILEKLDKLPISIWNYKKENASIRHLGPMAQDFYSIFNLGNNNTSISTIDPAGIALAAIKELNKKNYELEQKSAALDKKNNELEAKVNELSQLKAEMQTLKNSLAEIKATVQQNQEKRSTASVK